MVLCIVPTITDIMARIAPVNVKLMDYKDFNSIEVHPFIATHTWDEVIVVLSRGIKSGYIRQVLTRCNIVRPVIEDGTEIDYEVLSRVMEIYPNIAAECKRAYFAKQDIKEILVKAGVKFGKVFEV